MKHYTVGFLFNEKFDEVALTLKLRPEWQKGLYNGLGGKFEPEDHHVPENCMRREFREETGRDIEDWQRFFTLQGHFDDGPWTCHFFYATGNLEGLTSQTDEPVHIFNVENLLYTAMTPPSEIITNLRWLIPMAQALAGKEDKAIRYVGQEFYKPPMKGQGW